MKSLKTLMEDNSISEDMEDACKAYLELGISDNLDDFEEAYQGQYDSDEDFAQELGEIDKSAHWPNNCIDWEYAAKELMYDYSAEDGYYFRNL